MSEITVNVLGHKRAVHARVQDSLGDCIVAALAADPETIDEVAIALGRFLEQPDGFFDSWSSGVCLEPWDSGILSVDLNARLIVCSSSSTFGSYGEVEWHAVNGPSGRMFPYHLASDWLVSHDKRALKKLSASRSAERKRALLISVREVLYRRLPEFIVQKVFARQAQLSSMDERARNDLVREIHIEWLMSARDDLGGRSPRELMIDARHDHIVQDLGNQQHYWNFLRRSPPGIPRESGAYQFGGFGIHEVVMYYELARHLLHACAARLRKKPIRDAAIPAEIDYLLQLEQEWLHTPQHDDLPDRSPALIIDHERRRLPEVVSGEHAMIDHDCPMCQMMADERFGPTFWCMDGSNMDFDFAFSFCHTRKEWEGEQQEYEKFCRDSDSRHGTPIVFGGHAATPPATPPQKASDVIDLMIVPPRESDSAPKVWQNSYSNEQIIDSMPAASALPVMLFGIAAHLGELGENLKELGDGADCAGRLRAQFVELRRAISNRSATMAESHVAGFVDGIQELAIAHPSLAAKCADLERKLDRLLNRCNEWLE